jgi:hypothetical protein
MEKIKGNRKQSVGPPSLTYVYRTSKRVRRGSCTDETNVEGRLRAAVAAGDDSTEGEIMARKTHFPPMHTQGLLAGQRVETWAQSTPGPRLHGRREK